LTGPRQELADTGRLGSDGAELLYRTVVAVAAARNFPPPTGSASWDESAVAETAHNILDGPRGVKRLADALLRSTDESSFARILEGAAVNYLRDVARRTDLGKVILRVAVIRPAGGCPAARQLRVMRRRLSSHGQRDGRRTSSSQRGQVTGATRRSPTATRWCGS